MEPDPSIVAMRGLGRKSARELAKIGMTEARQLMESDPFMVYQRLKSHNPSTSLNFLYAIIGAIEDVPWQEIKKHRKTAILLRLDAMDLAPK